MPDITLFMKGSRSERGLMHTFMESIGLAELKTSRDLETLMENTNFKYDKEQYFQNENGSLCALYEKPMGSGMAIQFVGEFDDGKVIHPEYIIPVYKGSALSLEASCDYDKRAESDSYVAACEVPDLGSTVIFYMNNMAEFRNEVGDYTPGYEDGPDRKIYLSGLAKEGTVLLPVYKTEKDEEEYAKKITRRGRLVRDARDGDESAMETLSEEEMNEYQIVTMRLEEEDVLSIVDNCFLPYGLECDQYSIIGTIGSLNRVKNPYSGETVVLMDVEVCNVVISVCINADRLVGEPKPGRRFRGLIWLQGTIDFKTPVEAM